jgi:hypothetical protein
VQARLPLPWRAGIAAASLAALAAADIMAIRKGSYCRLGLRRQTPKTLHRRHDLLTVAAAWGFDTGLAVTTIRVAAATWGALALTALGFSSWRTGLAYGLGFAIPTLILFALQTFDDASLGSKLETMLGRRGALQAASAVLLCMAGGTLLVGAFG